MYQPSQDCYNQIMEHEGYSAMPYYDIQGYSIGYGHFTGKAVKGDLSLVPEAWRNGITQQQAYDIMVEDVQKVADFLNSYFKSKNFQMNQAKFDALCDFGFAAGVGRLLVVIKDINAGNYASAYTYMLTNGVTDGHGNVLQNVLDRHALVAQIIFGKTVTSNYLGVFLLAVAFGLAFAFVSISIKRKNK